jgi:hypothetical protein
MTAANLGVVFGRKHDPPRVRFAYMLMIIASPVPQPRFYDLEKLAESFPTWVLRLGSVNCRSSTRPVFSLLLPVRDLCD